VGQHLNPAHGDQRGLLVAMEQNLAEHSCHLHRHRADATVIQADDLLIADSGMDDDTFNIVGAARFTPQTAHRRIAETLTLLDATAAATLQALAPGSQPCKLHAMRAM
jgi:hypothetical protein